MPMFTSEDVWKALTDAQEYAQSGRFEEALERHVWYHENVLKFEPGHAGVRLSFGLSSWVSLGEVYPPALEALRNEQAKSHELFKQDPKNLSNYHDLYSIIFALNDMAAAKDLWSEANAIGIEDFLFESDLEQILQTGDPDWLRDIIGDPKEKLKRHFYQGQSIYYSMKSTKMSDNHAEYSLRSSAKKIAQLIQAVALIDGDEKAKELQKEAIALMDSPIIENALNKDYVFDEEFDFLDDEELP